MQRCNDVSSPQSSWKTAFQREIFPPRFSSFLELPSPFQIVHLCPLYLQMNCDWFSPPAQGISERTFDLQVSICILKEAWSHLGQLEIPSLPPLPVCLPALGLDRASQVGLKQQDRPDPLRRQRKTFFPPDLLKVGERGLLSKHRPVCYLSCPIDPWDCAVWIWSKHPGSR